MSPVWLAARVAAIVADPKWCGGVHRDYLRELLGCDHRDLRQAVSITYRRRLVDFCCSYVVQPPRPVTQERAA